MISSSIVRSLAIVLFGVIVPIVILGQAYLGLSSLGAVIQYTQTSDDLVNTLSKVKTSLSNGNDYALFSLLYTEHANQKTMINKQIMKVSIMQIGFAVASLGMMFVLLGFNDGGASGGVEISSLKFDFKSGSTGVVVFLLGSLMATAGGIIKNDYNTVPIPDYIYAPANVEYIKSISAFKECKNVGESDFPICFAGIFEKINQDALK